MILVGKYPSIKVQNATHSLFVKFNYDAEKVAKIKSLPVRFYEPNNKVWEVPMSDMDRVVNLFGVENIRIFNEFPEFEQYLRIREQKAKNAKSVDELIAYYENLKPEVEYNFKTKPDGHQIESFNTALHLDSLFITDAMGLGKTKQAIDICDYKKHVGLAKHVLIVCGVNGLKYNWMEEIKKHSWNNCQVIDGTTTQRLEKLMGYWKYFYNIINIESIRNNAKFDKKGNLIKENDNPILNLLIKLCDNGKFEVIVVDEFHKANNHKSQQGLGLRCLKAKYKIALSGTPITKRIERAWSILNWMGLETAKYWNFVKRYCVLGGFSGWEPTGEYKNLDELHERFDRFQIRRTKDILKLPPKVHKYVYVDMNTDEHNEYMDIKRGIIRDVESGDIKQINPAVATVKLRLFTDKIKARAIKEIIEELQDNDNPCVIFSMYKEGLYTLQKELAEYNPLLLTGDITSASKKQEIINAFQKEKRSDVLMGTIQAMGTGYTLTRSQYVVFLNKMWICTDNEQAEDRCHRRGTTGSVTVISVIVKNSIDERVEEILANDKMYIDKVVDGIPVFKMSNRQIFNKLMED